MTFNTGNPIGSTDARDLSDNAKNMDYLENSTTELTHADRLGTVRKTRHGMEAEHDAQISAHESEHDAQMQAFENDFDGRLAGMAFTRIGSFTAGYTLTNMRQTLEYNGHEYSWAGTFPKVVAAGATPATSGGIGAGAWVDRTDETLRSELASSGATMIYDGYASQSEINIADIRIYGAAPSPADSTSAFIAAYADSQHIFVPYGDWCTTIFYPDRTYGEGRVFSTYDADGLFQDSGERPILKEAKKSNQFAERVKTFGNYERAAGKSLIVNDDSGRAQVSGYTSDSQMATYINADHVGYYIGMKAPKNQLSTADSTTTYTETTLSAPEITQTNIDNEKIKVGMFVKTKHSPRMSGRVLSINAASNTLTVSGWWAEGNTLSGQVPTSGTGAIINAADKIWGQNTNVYIESASSCRTATGYELGILSDVQPANPVWGMHIVNLTGSTYEYNRAYFVSGKWTEALYATKDVSYGLHHIKPVAAVYLENIDDSGYGGFGLLFNNSYPDSPSKTLGIRNGVTTVWSIDGNGHRSSQRESVTVTASGVNVTPLTQSVILCTNTVDITITSSGSFKAGHIFEIRSAGTATVTFSGAKIAVNGYGRFVYDGSSWIRLI